MCPPNLRSRVPRTDNIKIEEVIYTSTHEMASRFDQNLGVVVDQLNNLVEAARQQNSSFNQFAARMNQIGNGLENLSRIVQRHDETLQRHDEAVQRHEETLQRHENLLGQIASALGELGSRQVCASAPRTQSQYRLEELAFIYVNDHTVRYICPYCSKDYTGSYVMTHIKSKCPRRNGA